MLRRIFLPSTTSATKTTAIFSVSSLNSNSQRFFFSANPNSSSSAEVVPQKQKQQQQTSSPLKKVFPSTKKPTTIFADDDYETTTAMQSSSSYRDRNQLVTKKQQQTSAEDKKNKWKKQHYHQQQQQEQYKNKRRRPQQQQQEEKSGENLTEDFWWRDFLSKSSSSSSKNTNNSNNDINADVIKGLNSVDAQQLLNDPAYEVSLLNTKNNENEKNSSSSSLLEEEEENDEFSNSNKIRTMGFSTTSSTSSVAENEEQQQQQQQQQEGELAHPDSISLTKFQKDILWEKRQDEYSVLRRNFMKAFESHHTLENKCLVLSALHKKTIERRMRLHTDLYEDFFLTFVRYGSSGAAASHQLFEIGDDERRVSLNSKSKRSKLVKLSKTRSMSSNVDDFGYSEVVWEAYRYCIESGAKPSHRIFQHVMQCLVFGGGGGTSSNSKAELEQRAHIVMMDLERFGLSPSVATLAMYIEICSKVGAMHVAMSAYVHAITKHEVEPNAAICTVMLDGFLLNADYDSAISFLSNIQNIPMDTILLNTMLNVFASSVSPSHKNNKSKHNNYNSNNLLEEEEEEEEGREKKQKDPLAAFSAFRTIVLPAASSPSASSNNNNFVTNIPIDEYTITTLTKAWKNGFASILFFQDCYRREMRKMMKMNNTSTTTSKKNLNDKKEIENNNNDNDTNKQKEEENNNKQLQVQQDENKKVQVEQQQKEEEKFLEESTKEIRQLLRLFARELKFLIAVSTSNRVKCNEVTLNKMLFCFHQLIVVCRFFHLDEESSMDEKKEKSLGDGEKSTKKKKKIDSKTKELAKKIDEHFSKMRDSLTAHMKRKGMRILNSVFLN